MEDIENARVMAITGDAIFVDKHENSDRLCKILKEIFPEEPIFRINPGITVDRIHKIITVSTAGSDPHFIVFERNNKMFATMRIEIFHGEQAQQEQQKEIIKLLQEL